MRAGASPGKCYSIGRMIPHSEARVQNPRQVAIMKEPTIVRVRHRTMCSLPCRPALNRHANTDLAVFSG